jgi:hypothetical protein
MPKQRSIIGGLIALGLLLFIGYVLVGEKITLIPEEQINLIAEPVSDPAKAVVVGKLQAEQGVEVVGCYDMKHYIVPKVRLENEQTAYVTEAKFRLERKPAWSTFGESTVISCGK